MPRSLDPSSRLTMVLAGDVDKVPQPRIFARTLTLNQQRKLMAAMDRMKTAANADDKISSAIDAAEVCLIGWENMTNPDDGTAIVFSRETIGDVLSIDELAEVFEAVTSAAKPSVIDKKKSE
jgi:hypothetical protein